MPSWPSDSCAKWPSSGRQPKLHIVHTSARPVPRAGTAQKGALERGGAHVHAAFSYPGQFAHFRVVTPNRAPETPSRSRRPRPRNGRSGRPLPSPSPTPDQEPYRLTDCEPAPMISGPSQTPRAPSHRMWARARFPSQPIRSRNRSESRVRPPMISGRYTLSMAAWRHRCPAGEPRLLPLQRPHRRTDRPAAAPRQRAAG